MGLRSLIWSCMPGAANRAAPIGRLCWTNTFWIYTGCESNTPVFSLDTWPGNLKIMIERGFKRPQFNEPCVPTAPRPTKYFSIMGIWMSGKRAAEFLSFAQSVRVGAGKYSSTIPLLGGENRNNPYGQKTLERCFNRGEEAWRLLPRIGGWINIFACFVSFAIL
jgi:hypothetical protein